jgi:hypothetical protein
VRLPTERNTTCKTCDENRLISIDQLWRSLVKFSAWLDAVGHETYDPYDIWGTKFGIFARRVYYTHPTVGAVLSAPVILMEILAPQLRTWFVKKDRYPTADAQVALAYLNLYDCGRLSSSGPRLRTAEFWLTKARNLADDLTRSGVSEYGGLGWGYPFDWQNVHGLIPRNTPHITATPYAYETFARLFDVTGEHRYEGIARLAADFTFNGIVDTPTGRGGAAASYTPNDATKVVNASAYRAFVLLDAAHRFGVKDFRAKALQNVRFILDSQRADGAWLYAVDDPSQAFIDHFHTCFVLKNLYKSNRYLESGEIDASIARGYQWYREALFDSADAPKVFAIAPRLELVTSEMYSYAEAITLGVLLRKRFPDAYALAQKLCARLMERYQLPEGYWITRVYRGGVRHKLPFLRWPQAQLFLAISNVLIAADDQHDGE